MTESLPSRFVTTRACGRVNLIGEHTDTTGGLVLPVPLAQGVTLRGLVRDDLPDDVVLLESDALGGTATLRPEVAPERSEPAWARYVAGVLAGTRAAGLALPGFHARIESDLPIGAGLASSAALEVASARLALGVARAARRPIPAALEDAWRIVDLCRDAEERAAGVPCGIMDQAAAVMGVPGRALLVDCGARCARIVDLGGLGAELLVVDSGVRHVHAGGEYAARRAQCEAAERALGRPLREAAVADVVGCRGMAPVLQRRARHVVSENSRVRDAVAAIEAGDSAALGALMDASHESLREDFEVSCPEVDALVARLRGMDGVLGSRMTGGGFGGATVSLVRADAVAGVAAQLRRAGLGARWVLRSA